MNFVQIIGLFPLMNEVLGVSIVGVTVVIVYSLANLEISKTNSSCNSSEVINLHIISSEEIKDLGCLRILNVKDVLTSNARVVRTVGDGTRVVIGIKFVEVHMIRL